MTEKRKEMRTSRLSPSKGEKGFGVEVGNNVSKRIRESVIEKGTGGGGGLVWKRR